MFKYQEEMKTAIDGFFMVLAGIGAVILVVLSAIVLFVVTIIKAGIRS